MIMGIFFNRANEQEKQVLEVEGDFTPEVYDHINAVVKLDKNGLLVSYNKAFAKQYGYTEQDFKEPFFNVLCKRDSLNCIQYLEKALLGKTEKFNTLGVTKNGTLIEINVTFIPIKEKNTIKDIYVIIKNITEYQDQKKELSLVQKRLEVFNDIKEICSFYYDAINDFHYFSKQFASIFGVDEERTFTPSLNYVLRFIHPEDSSRVKNTVQNGLREKTGYEMEFRIIKKDRTVRQIKVKTEVFLNKKGNLEGLVGFVQDVTDYGISDDISEKEKQIKLLYDNSDIGIWSFDMLTDKFNISKGIEYLAGYTNDEIYNGFQWPSIIHPEDLQKFMDIINSATESIMHQFRIIHKNGGIRWVQNYIIPSWNNNGQIVRLDGLISDITEQKVLEEKIKYLANYDVLTKLPNRNMFIERLNQIIDEYADSNNQFAVIKLNIDGFKYINDTLGNEVGDELLKQLPIRATKHLTSQDLLARRGEDQFMILVDKINSLDALKEIVKKINESLNKPFNIKEYQLYITVSIGICTYPENGVTSLELLRNASYALQNAKKRGKNNYHILSYSSSIQSYKNYSIGRDLKKAVENREMVLYFQTRVDAHSNQIISAEALIRWNHPEWGLISPHEFLTIAEENGLITEIDDWVLNEACNQIKNWKDRGMHLVPISINISAVHFLKPDWPRKVAEIIRDVGIHPSDMEFEITESTILNDSEIVKNSILMLKELGIKIALDDFGKGYSSLSYLTQYPFDVIKIDKSFIRNMHYSDRDLHLTKSIIYMAKGLNVRVVAEGVETIQQLKILQQEQCHEIQGYLFSHPVPVKEFEVLLQKKVLSPMDPKQKAKQSKRKHYRINLPSPLEADILLASIAGRAMQLGVSKVLIEDISIGGLRFVSDLKLPIRGDVIYRFKTEILGQIITFNGSIVWKEEINEDLMEYGIKFILEEDEQASLSTLLNSFSILLNNNTSLPPYRKVIVDKYQYFNNKL
ncbi:EAL domain-containing protein [Lysinibacillus yapensis]|uniref:EAL domain-containing protein n=1 Tax=Ureibacillus yapensis TaxID=2304605 RepID=A0A396SF66_9BACL|nr:EAL domain-containing protein [Lysinibacillus yapensis]RHW39974.1 EAL domain-containing protein [Lysinibacillus yapensis]